jgi:adenylate cyclase
MTKKKLDRPPVTAERTTVDPIPGPVPPARPRTFSDPFTNLEVTAPLVAASFEPSSDLSNARFEYASPDGKQHVRTIVGLLSIGRHTDNDVQLLDPEVSKHHLTVERKPDGVELVDLGSANGTLVNGRDTHRVMLVEGDIVLVGNTRLTYHAPVEKPPPGPRLSDPVEDIAGVEDPMTGPMTDPFAAMLSHGAIRQKPRSDPDRTVVTLVPDAQADSFTTNVFALPMKESFVRAEDADDKVIRRDYERLRVAFDLAVAVGLETNLESLGQHILERTKSVLPADTAVVMLRSEQGDLVPLASVVESGNAEVRIPRAIIEQVVRTREGLLTHDALADLNLRSSHTVVGQQIRSALCVPLVVGDTVYGVIHLSSSSAAGAYEERDLALLRAIAQPAALAVANARLVQRIEEDAKTRAELSRFLSPALVEKVVKRDIALGRQGDKVLATVLFSDIRGFTTMSDGANPERVVSMLNEYFEAMVDVVFKYGGTLDKFIGDGMMAVWGTPVTSPDDALMAVRAAEEMRKALDLIVNAARRRRSEAPLRVGCGIATGHVIAGAMGAQRRQDFTVIGDTVNLSSRLCSQAEPGQVLLCEETERRVSGAIRANALPPRSVKGFARMVPVFELPRSENSRPR